MWLHLEISPLKHQSSTVGEGALYPNMWFTFHFPNIIFKREAFNINKAQLITFEILFHGLCIWYYI